MALADGLLRRGARLLTGGTDNHLVVIDVAGSFGLTGRQAEAALLEAGVVTNRNSIPGDPNGAWYTSGIRLGPPALTTLGFGRAEMDEVAAIISETLSATTPASASSGPSKARYRLDAGIAGAGRGGRRSCCNGSRCTRSSACSRRSGAGPGARGIGGRGRRSRGRRLAIGE